MYKDGVTITIPCWNHEVFLARAIRSAMDAVHALDEVGIPGEILVVDDASRDGSRSLLRQLEARYHGEGLRVLVHPSNTGVATARNTALLKARFRYILFLDADDELIGANLPLFHRAIQDTQCAAVYGSSFVRELGHDKAFLMISHESFQNRLFEANYLDKLALFDRPQVIDVGGYNADWANWEDWELWGHLASSGRRIIFVPVAMGYYDQIANSKLRMMKNPEDMFARLRRTFNQTGSRDHLPTNSNLLRYHPAVGYL
jgi:glycosyltransferase involved in cell wall biosynthesis